MQENTKYHAAILYKKQLTATVLVLKTVINFQILAYNCHFLIFEQINFVW